MYIDINGMNIYYNVTGKGKDLLLLHGWGGSSDSFKKVHQYYEKSFRTFSIDLPGFGKSDEPKQVWGVGEYSDFLCKFLDVLNINNPIVMAHSFGGRITIYTSPNRKFNKIVLIDSAGIKPKRSMKYYAKVYTYKLIKKVVYLPLVKEIFLSRFEAYRNKSGSQDYKNASEMMKKVLIKSVNQDLKAYLPLIKVPTLLVWGENDTATPVRDAKIMERLIPDAGLVVFKDAGHFSYLEQFSRFTSVVDSFLREDMEVNNV